MNRLPEPPGRQPHATQAGQPTTNTAAQAFLADLESAFTTTNTAKTTPTAYRDDTLPATYTTGPTAPVPQPGRPPMSQRAVDLNTTILCTGIASLPIGGMTSLVVYTLGQVDPAALAIAAAAPATIALPILALARFLRRARQVVEAAPPVIHQHYTGTVHQDTRTVNSTNRGLWASNRNQLPAGD
ncbi:hypothetical protein D0Z67_29135 (plasmid) [Streptomyces seoulensis]|uniref:Uncharacterized protein n=1 Tax=Streptomyces seoulensis TaxID=73044 RepID=A0A4P6U511_STRSO|nr:hypothetical protein [Streptomyces seoulensis]QBJ94437.1 hypothetical protein D0Z67_29135 [Streptomyces seoulensis]